MLNRRKAKDWPRLGSKAKKFQSVLKLLPPAHLETLKRIYLELDITSDCFLMDPDLMEKLARRFQEETGKRVKGNVLVGVIIAQRKRGLWIKISEPFADIEVIAKQSAS